MNGNKESSHRGKETPSISKHKLDAKDHDSFANIPIIRISENEQLPMYYAILSQSTENGINNWSWSEVDSLQQDLEKLLSASAVRHRYLRNECDILDGAEENLEKKEKDFETISSKRRRVYEKSKDKVNPRVKVKLQCIPVNRSMFIRNDRKESALPRNKTLDSFWNSVEPYCAKINKNDLKFVDELIEEFSKNIDLRIPIIREEFTNRLLEELEIKLKEYEADDNENEENLDTSPKPVPEPKTNGVDSTISIKEEKPFIARPPPEPPFKSGYLRIPTICRDRLLQQGILRTEIKTESEIISEIKKCQQELVTVNKYNLSELNKLRDIIKNDLKKQEIKRQLDEVDNKILDLYTKINHIITNKSKLAMKQVQQCFLLSTEDQRQDEFDKETIRQQIVNELKNEPERLLKIQLALHKELNDLSEGTFY